MQIAANPDATARQGDIMVNDQRARIRQDAAACRFVLSTTEQTVPAGGGTGNISVTAATGCAWSAQADAAWVVLTGGTSGTGSGSVSFTIGSNTGTTTRSASIVVAGQTVKVTQQSNASTRPLPTPGSPASCSVTVTPKDLTFGPSGTNSSSISVAASSSCEWSAHSDTSWISLTGRTSGTGNGTVTFSVAANNGPTRRGELTIGDQTVPVNQGAATVGCSYSVTPTTVSINAAGGSGTPISVSTASGCSWTATTSAGWITILTGASGTGNGSVTYSVQANTGSSRGGTLTVAGQSVSISQGAACTYSISRNNDNVDKEGGNGTVSVTTQSGCTWTASSNANWITITSGSTGSGNGSVHFTAAANNTGNNRTGTLTIAGQTFTLTQKK
jgi:hypothetical protein